MDNHALPIMISIILIIIIIAASVFFLFSRIEKMKKEKKTFDGNEIVVKNQDELSEP
jgi:large-conductance mechanosensitive channel